MRLSYDDISGRRIEIEPYIKKEGMLVVKLISWNRVIEEDVIDRRALYDWLEDRERM
jgi:hypothetical protein